MIRFLSSTASRVEDHTATDVNQEIHRRTVNCVRCLSQHPEAIDDRLEELDREWDIERRLEANASGLALVGLTLGVLVSRWFLLLPFVVMGFLLQHALQGWCPPLPVFRRLGARTAGEIEAERYALKAVRGDFEELGGQPQERARQVMNAIER